MNVGYAYTTLAPGLIGNTIPPDVNAELQNPLVKNLPTPLLHFEAQ